jgi:type I restriction enzyme, S subunit
MNQLGKPHGALGVSPHDGIISPAYFVARVGNLAEPRFVHHLLRTRLYISEYERRGKFMPPSQFDISWEQFRSIEVLLPPRQVQRAIADFLDAETVRIDALIEKKQRMVELLDERLNSYRVRTVLGMTRDVQLRQSPSGLYGLVPTSWAETSLRHLGCEVQTGPFGSQLHAEDYIEGGWPVVNPMNLVGGTITPTPSMAISDEKRAELSRHILRAGDIVFGRRGEMGRAGLVGQYETGWLCGTGSLRLRLVGSYLSPTYLKLLLETPPARAYFELASVGSTMDNLNSEIVLDFPTLVPTLSEQDSIASAVAEMLGAVNRLGMALGRQLSIARERRQALITAAVTGELDIPGMAA